MTPELSEHVFPIFLKAIRHRLREALACADAADAYLTEGGQDRALEIALDVEVLTAEANTLLAAAAIIQRRSREKVSFDQE